MMDISKLERQLTRVIKAEVASLEAFAVIASALLEIAREIDTISRNKSASRSDQTLPRRSSIIDEDAT